jgi:prepilin-type N-terminal cleavage/methylation domain-containing protein
MRKSPQSAFTLLEMMAVIAIIVVLAGLVLSVAGYATRRSSQARAAGEIKMLESGCENYKNENGAYPREIVSNNGSGVTDVLSPKLHFTPTASQYSNASLFLYKELSGDKKGASGSLPDGAPEEGEPRYLKDLDPRILNAKRDPASKAILQVNYFQDPYGFPYGYSTAAAKAEQDFQRELMIWNTKRSGAPPKRPTGSQIPGFNSGSYDLWSTGGSSPSSAPSSDQSKEQEWAKWIKNW